MSKGMRMATISDYWRHTYDRKYNIDIKNIDMGNQYGIGNIIFKKGIYTICGLNGAGKTTVLTFLKDMLGIPITIEDTDKIGSLKINGLINIDKNDYKCSNNDGSRLIDYIPECKLFYYDQSLSLEVLKFLHQDNLDELLKQFEEIEMTSEQLVIIGKMVGKSYKKCLVTTIEDEEKLIPYFFVTSQGISYNSLSMGLGEHNLIYLYWFISNAPNNSVILIEEIETFLSIYSQKTVMDFMAKAAGERGLVIIISTHSPYIIQKIPIGNICVLERFGNTVNVSYPSGNKKALRKLGMEVEKSGILYVEDDVAEIFLKTILNKNDFYLLSDYYIEDLGGEGEVRNRLKYKTSKKSKYKTIGVFDGDMKVKITEKEIAEFNSPFILLPSNNGIEDEFKEVIQFKLSDFAKNMNKPEGDILSIITAIDGDDPHDWFIKFAEQLNIEKSQLFEEIYKLWLNDEREEKVTEFIYNIHVTMGIDDPNVIGLKIVRDGAMESDINIKYFSKRTEAENFYKENGVEKYYILIRKDGKEEDWIKSVKGLEESDGSKTIGFLADLDSKKTASDKFDEFLINSELKVLEKYPK